MKKIYSLLLLLLPAFAFSQILDNKRPLPAVDLKSIDGTSVNSSTFDNGDAPIVISFWATWCKPCVTELTNISEVYDEWQKETGVKLIAISIDDARNQTKVAPFVNGKGWDYEVYLDMNADLKRALNVNLVPHTFLLDKDNQIVWQHNSYAEGDEEHLYELIKKLVAGQEVSEE
ncbi:MAG: TlpA family protein disulfide reductase [Bacteroidetes bacterium]|nr:TlpA family protein disulfide reductase [Bacteroidota bacterium]